MISQTEYNRRFNEMATHMTKTRMIYSNDPELAAFEKHEVRLERSAGRKMKKR